MERAAEWVTAAPSPRLASFIDRYIGYRMSGFPPGLHRGLPSRHMTFIVSIGPGIDVVSQTDPGQSPARYRCVASGMQASPALIAHAGGQEGVVIELTPLGCRALFGMPARALWNTSVEYADVAGPAGRELWERLQHPAEWAERFATCDQVLTRVATTDLIVAPELRHAWHTLTTSGGTAPIAALAAGVGWSRQHLARRFADEFGLGPKLAARVIRFERARRMLQTTPPRWCETSRTKTTARAGSPSATRRATCGASAPTPANRRRRDRPHPRRTSGCRGRKCFTSQHCGGPARPTRDGPEVVREEDLASWARRLNTWP